MSILWLGNAECHHPEQVGGKAASLSRLAAEFRVPPGFCITHPIDVTDEAVASAYCDLATRSGRPGDARLAVAVRSSAVDEDGALASFAGQHETLLNVRGIDALREAIARCVASARSERAMEYRRQNGLGTADVRLCVLVQQLVQADVAAVIFSANPISGNRDEIVINASWGLGESIVGGTVTPDCFLLDTRQHPRQIVRATIGSKLRMTIAAGSGSREVPVPRILRGRLCLDHAQLHAMAILAHRLAGAMGCQVDIECAWHGRTLYVLQCRPITGLTLPPSTIPGIEQRLVSA